MRTFCRERFQKVSELCELRAARAFVIERAIAEELELGTMISVFIHLAVAELDRADGRVRSKLGLAAIAQSSVARERAMLIEPASDGRRRHAQPAFRVQSRCGAGHPV